MYNKEVSLFSQQQTWNVLQLHDSVIVLAEHVAAEDVRKKMSVVLVLLMGRLFVDGANLEL